METRNNKKDFDRRYFPTDVRMEEDEGKTYFVGNAAVYNSRSENLGWGDVRIFEFIEPGFFDEALAKSDIRCLKNHNSNLILGRRKPGAENPTLELSADGALSYRCLCGDTSTARDTMEEMKRGDIDGSSFGFSIKYISDGDDIDGIRWERQENGDWYSYLVPNGCKRIYDVGPVTFPAYPDTSSGLSERQHRSFEAAKAAFERDQKPKFRKELLEAIIEDDKLL